MISIYIYFLNQHLHIANSKFRTWDSLRRTNFCTGNLCAEIVHYLFESSFSRMDSLCEIDFPTGNPGTKSISRQGIPAENCMNLVMSPGIAGQN